MKHASPAPPASSDKPSKRAKQPSSSTATIFSSAAEITPSGVPPIPHSRST